MTKLSALAAVKQFVSFDHNSHKHVESKLVAVKSYDEAIRVLVDNGFLLSPYIKEAIKAAMDGVAPKGNKAAVQTAKELEEMKKVEEEAKAKAIELRNEEDAKLVEETKKALAEETDAAIAKAVAEALDAKDKENKNK